MKDILDHLKIVLRELEKEYGKIFLFAFFLREETLGKWDLLISASWLDPRALNSYEKVTKKIQKHLNEKEFFQIARIVILDLNDPGVVFLQDLYSVPNGSCVEVFNCKPLTERFGFVWQFMTPVSSAQLEI